MLLSTLFISFQVPDPEMMINPQTKLLCDMLGVTNPFAVFMGLEADNMGTSDQDVSSEEQPEDISDEEDEPASPPSFIDTTLEVTLDSSQDVSMLNVTSNPDEITLDDDDHDCNDGKAQKCDPDASEIISNPAEISLDDLEDDDSGGHDMSQSDMEVPSALSCNSGETSQDEEEKLIEQKQKLMDNCLPSESTVLDNEDIVTEQTPVMELNLNEPITHEHLRNLSVVGSSTPASSESPRRSPSGKRSSDDSDSSLLSSPNKSMDSDLDTSRDEFGRTNPKKFKRRNQTIYTTSTEDDSLT